MKGNFGGILSGREARRQQKENARRRGAGWTRQFRKGRVQRLPIQTSTKETP
jgi:hypothetical protein